jgi:hypothetical protein
MKDIMETGNITELEHPVLDLEGSTFVLFEMTKHDSCKIWIPRHGNADTFTEFKN